MAGSSETDLKGNIKRTWPRYHLRHAAVHSDYQGSHACARLSEEGTVTEDKKSAAGSRGETENCDRSLGLSFKLLLIINNFPMTHVKYTCKNDMTRIFLWIVLF